MLFTSKEIACAACVSDNLQFMQDIRRHHLPIESRRHNGRNTYDMCSFAVSLIIGELKEFGISLSGCGRLLNRVDLDELSHCIAKLHSDEIEELIVLIPQRGDFDEEFPTTVTIWDQVRHFGKEESINFIPIAIADLLKGKFRGEW